MDVTDIEFIQFHPTMLFDRNGSGRRPLITEALRGEGAILLDARGKSVMADVHPMGDLAPRDVVAAAIEARLRRSGDECVFLDARSIERFAERFPTVNAACREAGIDPTVSPIPVVPGAHYSCGGVSTDVHGRTSLPGLYAAGEVARTGMHGANRLASNSLLEGLVVGGRAGREAAGHAKIADAPMAKVQPAQRYALDRGELQQAMTRWASVVRDADGLNLLIDELACAAPRTMVTRTDVEDVALTVSASAVAVAALARTETRGCHHRGDFPDTDPAQAVPVSVHGTVDGRVTLAAVPVAR